MKLATWGTNNNYEGGTGTRTPANPSPVVATLVPDAVEVAAAYHFNVIRTASGRVLTFGSNSNGGLGDGTHADKSTPVDIGLSDIVKIGAGGAHACALRADGALFLWGIGPIGDGRELGEGKGTAVPVQLPFVFRDVFTGGPNCFAIDAKGQVWGWGWNGRGQIGDGTKTDRLSPVLLDVEAKEIACAGIGGQIAHTLFLRPDGLVEACGSNNVGQSGVPGTASIPTPVLVPGVEDVVKIEASNGDSYAITSDGKLWGWGKLAGGYTPVILLEGISDVAANVGCFLAISEGVLIGTGNNRSGQLGDGTREDKAENTMVQNLNNVAQVAIGQADDATHVAALHMGELSVTVAITATPIPGGLRVDWEAGETDKPWQIKHRPVVRPLAEWIHDGTVPPPSRLYILGELESGKEYEVFVQNGDFAWKIVRGVAG